MYQKYSNYNPYYNRFLQFQYFIIYHYINSDSYQLDNYCCLFNYEIKHVNVLESIGQKTTSDNPFSGQEAYYLAKIGNYSVRVIQKMTGLNQYQQKNFSDQNNQTVNYCSLTSLEIDYIETFFNSCRSLFNNQKLSVFLKKSLGYGKSSYRREWEIRYLTTLFYLQDKNRVYFLKLLGFLDPQIEELNVIERKIRQENPVDPLHFDLFNISYSLGYSKKVPLYNYLVTSKKANYDFTDSILSINQLDLLEVFFKKTKRYVINSLIGPILKKEIKK